MKTFGEWIESVVWGSKLSLPNYNHYICDKCGQSLDDNWVDSMGAECTCGGILRKAEPGNIDNEIYKKKYKRPLALRGSSK